MCKVGRTEGRRVRGDADHAGRRGSRERPCVHREFDPSVFARDRDQRFPAETGESVHGVSGAKRSRIAAGFLAVTRAPADLQRGRRAEIPGHGETYGFKIDRPDEGDAPNRLCKSAVLRIRDASNESDLRRSD